MPELPEVETVARGLQAFLPGRTITGVDVHWERSVIPADPPAFARQIVGRRVIGVSRRGKWIVIGLDDGRSLLVHLRMTGRLVVGQETVLGPGECQQERHVRVTFSLDALDNERQTLKFCDQRKFGRLWLVDDPDESLADLGPEPLGEGFTPQVLAAKLAERRRRIKPLLLDQHFLAGLGNIYADEALWRAGVHPRRPACSLTPAEVRRLFQAIQTVLRAAIAEGGTTLPDATYQRLDGSVGDFAPELAAYGREGEPCPRCGTPIERIRLAQRSTHFCPRCQEEDKEARR